MLPLGKFPRFVVALALLVAALHLLDLEAVHDKVKSLFYSNSLDFLMVFLAAVCAFWAARRCEGYARQLWTLLAVGLTLETIAQAISTYYQSFVPGYSAMPLPSDFLYFIWAVPIFMMFLPSSDEKSRGWDLLRFLDFAQITVVAATAYLYFFYIPSRWHANSADFPRQILILYIARDAVLSGGFLFRWRASTSRGLRVFSLALFFVFLGIVITEGDYLFNLNTFMGAASWGDFLFLIPYFLVILLAVRWKYTQSDSVAEPPSRFTDLTVTHVLPVCIPLLVIFMSRAIAREQVVIAWLSVAVSFLLAAMRLILTNRRQRRIGEELLNTEKSLRRSERMFASAFRSSPDAFTINIFPDGPYIDVNEGFSRMTGIPREEVLGKTPKELNLWLNPSRRTQLLTHLAEVGELQDAEFQYRTRSGEIRTGLFSAAILDIDGRRCALALVRDITARKVAEELLRTSEERFRSLVEHLHVGIAWFDPQARVQFANRAALDLFGVRISDIQGKTTMELGLQPFSEDGVPIPMQARPLQQVISSGLPVRNQVFGWRLGSNHNTLWTLLDAIPERDADNKLIGILVSLTNVTQQRDAIAALSESEERFRTLVRDLHVGVVLHYPDGRLEFVNQAALDMFGVPESRAIGSDINTLGIIPIDEQGRETPLSDLPLYIVLREKRAVRNGTMGWRRPGFKETLWIFGNAIPQFNPDGSILRVIASFTDITELKNAERSIHQLSTELLKLQDEERRRIGRELHDGMAQTVLAVNLSLAQLRQSAHPLNEASNQALEKARGLLQQMSREIRTLSYLLHPPLLDDLGLVSALKEYVNGFSERSGIETTLELQSRFRRLPQIAETALFRITQESLSNIQRHSGSNRARVVLREDADAVTLEITDYGRGINFPDNGAPHRGQPRLGVGIPGMRERMAQLGGSLDIDSGPSGTTVRAHILLSAPVLKEAHHDAPAYPHRG